MGKMRGICALAVVVALFAPVFSWAKPPPNILKAVLSAYPPADDNRGLNSAYVEPDPSKFRGGVIVEKGGILAERAKFFISWDEYDYRGVVVHAEQNDEITSRRGNPYTYLKKGDVMAVAGVKDFGRTIFIKLISPEVYIPEERALDKRFSRVTVMLGFKFSKEIYDRDDAEAVMKKMAEWIRPFPEINAAKTYAGSSGNARFSNEPVSPSSNAIADKQAKKTESQKEVIPFEKSEAARVQTLEQKIDAARRQIEEAEMEMKQLKNSK